MSNRPDGFRLIHATLYSPPGCSEAIQEVRVSAEMESFFQGETKDYISSFYDMINEWVGYDLDLLAEAYRVSFFDDKSDLYTTKKILDGAALSIDYWLLPDNSVRAVVDADALRAHLKVCGRKTRKRLDRIDYLGRLVSRLCDDTCGLMQSTVTALVKRREEKII